MEKKKQMNCIEKVEKDLTAYVKRVTGVELSVRFEYPCTLRFRMKNEDGTEITESDFCISDERGLESGCIIYNCNARDGVREDNRLRNAFGILYHEYHAQRRISNSFEALAEARNGKEACNE